MGMGLFGRRKSKGAEHEDPVCGMVVAEKRAVGPDTIRGEAYWFCSVGCQETYRERTGGRRSLRDQARERKERKQEVAR
jgi:YHS domain-containing protein